MVTTCISPTYCKCRHNRRYRKLWLWTSSSEQKNLRPGALFNIMRKYNSHRYEHFQQEDSEKAYSPSSSLSSDGHNGNGVAASYTSKLT
ncbi:hypothetical protein LIER_17732 [Lithospermum erythrorhizon]|uniref:Uncharacterized protein n=1 Tax=Lithospermum erythrorhizon TaxID=34254 RepID=A0AAV3QCS7_LITER